MLLVSKVFGGIYEFKVRSVLSQLIFSHLGKYCYILVSFSCSIICGLSCLTFDRKKRVLFSVL